jgi:hypothetical protein
MKWILPISFGAILLGTITGSTLAPSEVLANKKPTLERIEYSASGAIYRDSQTGCQYLVLPYEAMTIRLNRHGRPMCPDVD